MKVRIFVLFVLAMVTSFTGRSAPALIPIPQTMVVRNGTFTLCPVTTNANLPARATTVILVDGPSAPTGQYLAALLQKSTGYQFQVVTNKGSNVLKGSIFLTTSNANASLGAEGYELTIAPDSVVIRAPQPAGVFYGVQTFRELLPPQALAPHPVTNVPWTVSCVFIQDQPRFSWRGTMLDCSRHIYTKQEIKQVLDTMAFHKLNTFHWHLVDDQGWRIEILKYPLLTQVGAWRNGIDYGLNPRASTAYNALNQYGGYYTQADAREIVAYAQQLHITVVPEIEMPGHSTAALASYPQFSCRSNAVFSMDTINYTYDVYSPGTAGTYGFLQDILTEIMGIFPGKYIHTGGDEVSTSIWTTNIPDMNQMIALGINPAGTGAVKAYQSWFSAQIANFLSSKGRTMIGWSEIEYGGVLTNAAVMDWITGSGSEAIPAASAGRPVVMTPQNTCYYNEYQTQNFTIEPAGQSGYVPLSNAYNFEPVPATLPAQYTSNILGAQANLWGEYIPGLTNSQYRAFPRLCAMSEITWSAAAQKNYSNFLARLVTQEQRLTQMGVNYNHEALTQIGAWAPPIATNGTTLTINITTNLTSAGDVNINFSYISGANGIKIASVALLQNGVQIDVDAHAGVAGPTQTIPIYILHLPVYKPSATYTIQAAISGNGGTASTGIVYLPNWN